MNGETEDDAPAEAVRALLQAYGLDSGPRNCRETPRRVAATFRELLAGVGQDELAPLRRGDAVPDGLDIVCLREIEFRSLCAHHLLPFSGVVSVAYVPVRRIVGIGSIVRTLDILSTRPLLQKALAQQLRRPSAPARTPREHWCSSRPGIRASRTGDRGRRSHAWRRSPPRVTCGRARARARRSSSCAARASEQHHRCLG